MSYLALYRKYRPKDFNEVIGQKHIIRTIQNAVKNDKINHAYLFSGPRGTGKTTMARILAKAVNCEHPDSSLRPCNACANCIAIQENRFDDIIEIDGASNNGVENIRNLIENVKYPPLYGKYKVYIIDEVHVITDAAFNALLKTLEEPPSHVIFILATTEPHKVLPTILSRCQRYDFSKVEINQLVLNMNRILKDLQIPYEEKAIQLIATLSDGGVRDSLSILEQVISYNSTNITEETVKRIYGVASTEDVAKYLELIYTNKISDLVQFIEEMEQKGIDLVRFTMFVYSFVKELLLYKKINDLKVLKYLKKKYLETFDDINVPILFATLDILLETQQNYQKVTEIKDYFIIASIKLSELKTIAKTPKPIVTPIENKAPVKKEEKLEDLKPIKDEDILNVLVHSLEDQKKVNKISLNERWNLIPSYQYHAKYQDVVSCFLGGKLAAVSQNAFLITFKTNSETNKFNQMYQNKKFETLILELFDTRRFLLAVNETKFLELRTKFKELNDAKSLPKPYSFFTETKNTSSDLSQFSSLGLKLDDIEVKK